MNMQKALETKSLTLSYGETTIINELNLEIPKGKITIFIGSNGCGKSTLLRSLARLLKPTSGDILLEDNAIQNMQTKQIARQMAILPQGPQAPEGLTCTATCETRTLPISNMAEAMVRKR